MQLPELPVAGVRGERASHIPEELQARHNVLLAPERILICASGSPYIHTSSFSSSPSDGYFLDTMGHTLSQDKTCTSARSGCSKVQQWLR